MVLDKGLSLAATQGLIETGAPFIDIVKFGWGTSRLLGRDLLAAKAKLLKAHGIKVCPGGTFLELAFVRDRVDAFLGDADELGFDCIEVSNGTVAMTPSQKASLVAAAARAGFAVVSEVGRKDTHADSALRAADRLAEVERDLESGAWRVIVESRESGTAGIFDTKGSVKHDVADVLLADGVRDSLIFEAPLKGQQLWLIQNAGNDVNIGNVPPDEVIPLETLRCGLRADTLPMYHLPSPLEVTVALGVKGALDAARQGNVVVVIDALRASGTILAALKSGVARIMPVASAEECIGPLTAGERGGEKIPGMTHANSPLEFLRENYQGQTLRLTTTNGTECIRAAAAGATAVFIGTTLNATAVARAAVSFASGGKRRITLVCAGRNNQPAIEDQIAAGEILRRIPHAVVQGALEPIYSADPVREFLASDSGRNLCALGYTDDVTFCARVDFFDFCAIFRDGFLQRAR